MPSESESVKHPSQNAEPAPRPLRLASGIVLLALFRFGPLGFLVYLVATRVRPGSQPTPAAVG